MRAFALPSLLVRSLELMVLGGGVLAAPLPVLRFTPVPAVQAKPVNHLAGLRLDATLEVGLNLLVSA